MEKFKYIEEIWMEIKFIYKIQCLFPIKTSESYLYHLWNSLVELRGQLIMNISKNKQTTEKQQQLNMSLLCIFKTYFYLFDVFLYFFSISIFSVVYCDYFADIFIHTYLKFASFLIIIFFCKLTFQVTK